MNELSRTERTDTAARDTHVQTVTPSSPEEQAAMLMQAVQTAVAAGKDADTIEKLLAMSERIMDRQAEARFWNDFHQARADMPPIKARGKNSQTNSSYELMEDVLEKIEPVYSRHGFSLSFWSEVSEVPDHRRIYCKIAHVSGHTEVRHTDMPLDLTGAKGTQNKTRVHASGSADTYGQRYLVRQIWNLRVIKNPLDDDGNAGAGVELITDEQAANLTALFDEVGGNLKLFLQPYGCETIDTMPVRFFQAAVRRLEKKRAQS